MPASVAQNTRKEFKAPERTLFDYVPVIQLLCIDLNEKGLREVDVSQNEKKVPQPACLAARMIILLNLVLYKYMIVQSNTMLCYQKKL